MRKSFVLVLGAWFFFAALGAEGIITSDSSGSHVLSDGVPLDINPATWPPFGNPPLDHDSVQRLEFDRIGTSRSFCSSALIGTSMGPAALIAAHCVVDSAGMVFASNFEMTVIDSFGFPVVFTSTDPNDVFVHPNYDGNAWHGYDLALVLLDGSTFGVHFNQVSDGSFSPLGRTIVKFGFGRFGFGANGAQGLDEEKRWGLNEYEAYGLGDFGVESPLGQGWKNTDVQLTMDFDDGSLIAHNVFNFYGGFLSPPITEMCNNYQSCGYLGNEVMGAPGDSGGPNFALDPKTGQWVIVAVNSYIARVAPDGLNGTMGNPDVTSGWDFSWGEYEGDALVTTAIINQILGLAPAPPVGPITGASSPISASGGVLGPEPLPTRGKS